jgi:PAS domain S-box-containing protein
MVSGADGTSVSDSAGFNQDFLALCKSASIGLCAFDRELRFVFINEWLARINGLPVDDHLGRTLSEILPEVAKGVEPQLRGVIETGEPVVAGSVEAETSAQIDKRYFEHYFSATKSNDGVIQGVVCIVHDVTERKRTEKRLEDSEKRTRAWLEHSPACTKIVDPDFNLQYMSAAGIEGLRIDDITRYYGKPYPFYFYPESFRKCMTTNLEKVLETGEVITQEASVVDVEGKELWFHSTLVPINSETGGIDYIMIVSIDVTGRRQAEEESRNLEQKMFQTQALESLGVMAGGIAHDFNNLLHVIAGNVTYALSEMPTEASSRENLLEIQTAVRRATELTDQMLAYSGKRTLVIEKLDLTSVVREMAQLLEVSHSKRAVVKYAFDENLPAIGCDPAQLRQVVMNLITNASEAIGNESGSISIETGVLYAKDEQVSRGGFKEKLLDGRYVYLNVTDTGCGMDEETQRLMFDPFFTTKFTGRGLGLAAVIGIMRAHAGGIDIDSEPGKGTTFKVMFPALNESAETSSVETPIENNWIGEGTILVVDDEASVRKLTELVLKNKGFNVLIAADGREAIDVFCKHENEIDLVLLDQTMPVMGGDESLIELRQICEDVRVVLLSGYGEREIKAHATDLGYSGFLKKPVDNDLLLETIHTILKGIDDG